MEIKENINIVSTYELKPENIAINSGTVTIDPGVFTETGHYHSGVIRPKNDWRPLESMESQIIFGNKTWNNTNSIILTKLPSLLKNLFFDAKLYRCSISAAEHKILLEGPLPLFANVIGAYLTENICDTFDFHDFAINCTKPGFESTTYDSSQKRYRGLHVDNWSKGKLASSRGKSGFRIGINLGQEKRDFVFVNLTIDHLISKLKNKITHNQLSRFTNRDNMTPLIEAFLTTYQSYPVVKITLEPGESYIAPVNNFIHDGYPALKSKTDYSFQMSAHKMTLKQTFLEKLSHTVN